MKQLKKLIVSTLQELIDAMEDKENEVIHVKGKITGSPSLYLSPGQQLVGDGNSIIEFKERADGIEISRDNTIDGLTFIVEPTRRAIYNKPDEESLGTLSLKNIKTIGQVQIVATGTIRSGHVVAQNVEVIKADTRELQDRQKDLAFMSCKEHSHYGIVKPIKT